MKYVYYVLLFFAMMLSACSTPSTFSYSSVETKVIASRVNDVYTLRVEGRDDSRSAATHQACKQAVHDIIFKNLYKTFGDHSMLRALANDPSIEQKNQQYFNLFFADGGEFEKYIEGTDIERETRHTDVMTVCIVNVAVNRGALRDKLIRDGILK